MNLECLDSIKGESAREYAYRILKFNILNLYLEPGHPISENEIGERLNISRTPVREAFIRLAQDKLLDIYPQKGTNVSKINLDYVEEGWFTRITLESAIVGLLCENFVTEELIKDLEENLYMQDYYSSKKDLFKLMSMDEAFHRLLYKACKKERTCTIIEGLNYDYYRTRVLSLSSIIKLETLLVQHMDIKNAILEKDRVRAMKAMEEHLNSVKFDEEILKRDYPEFLFY